MPKSQKCPIGLIGLISPNSIGLICPISPKIIVIAPVLSFSIFQSFNF